MWPGFLQQYISGALGFILGGGVGIVVSYYFQAGALRFIMSLGDYVASFDKMLGDKSTSTTAIASVMVFSVVGAAIGIVLAMYRNRS